MGKGDPSQDREALIKAHKDGNFARRMRRQILKGVSEFFHG